MGYFVSCTIAPLLLLVIYSSLIRLTTAVDTLSVNQSIQHSESLVSIANTFKLGFFSPGNSNRHYVGIMYNIPVSSMTVIWVANRDKPMYDSNGTFELSRDGNIVVLDGRREIVWSSNLTNPLSNSSARLLDTGNLVLQDNGDGRILWESFAHPSDSFVEKMRLLTDLSTGERVILTSWKRPDDPALGSFTSTIEPLDIPQSFIWNGSKPYWRSGPWNGQIFSGVPYMESFYKHGFDLENSNGTSYITFTNINSSFIVYYELNSSGIILGKVWAPGKNDWEVTWTSKDTECDVYGKCGNFGKCNARDKSICMCFPGFEPESRAEWDAGNWSSGCIRKTPLACERNNTGEDTGQKDGFLEVKGVKLPDRLKWFPTMKSECGNQCLNNCTCVAYAYDAGIGCMLWTGNLIDVLKFPNGGSNLYIRLAHSELGNRKDQTKIITITVVLGCITIPLGAYFLWKFMLKHKGRKKTHDMCSMTGDKDPVNMKERNPRDDVYRFKIDELPLFKFEVLSEATGNFDPVNKLGQGGFGPVYKGKLLNDQEIAIKRLARSSNQGIEEFMNEVVVISKLQHRNLVRLHGFCVEHEETMLVYEYMPNRSLDAHLFDSRKRVLDWSQRVIIIEGICRGLLYLHRDSRLRIIHRDLKASNILLDEELNPKISDFGMARIFGGKEDQANTNRVVGTYGYMAPEYALHGRFSEKSDVYSFGVLLLEIVCGRKNSSFHDEEQGYSLIAYVWKLWNEGNVMEFVDAAIYDRLRKDEIMRYSHVGLLCVQEVAKSRPKISTVLSMLSSEILDLPRPTQPVFTANQSTSETESYRRSLSKLSVNEVSLTLLQGR